MTDQLIIVGAGGFGLEAAAYAEDIIRLRGVDFSIAGYLDDTKPVGTLHGDYRVLGNTEGDLDPAALYIVALGFPQQRRAMSEKLAARGARFATLMHPAAYIASTAKIGAGSIITPFAVIGPQVRLGEQVLVNVSATVGHEAVVGDYCVLAPHAAIHGKAELEPEVFVGTSAVVTNGQTIGARSKLSAGAVAYNSMPSEVVALGNPARWREGEE